MQQQITSNILMIRPVNFGFNPETAESNAFMQNPGVLSAETQPKAQQLFDRFVEILRFNDVNVFVFEDRLEPNTPDSIFPNNWVSFHHSGQILLYPMEAKNRRLERRMDILESLKENFHLSEIIDLSAFENHNAYLEGTGSLVLDRIHRVAYACLSTRTHQNVLKAWNEKMPNYELLTFSAVDQQDKSIYHTNVMMCMGDSFAVVCLDAIFDLEERQHLIDKLRETNKDIVEISYEQMNAFAGNMLLIKNNLGRKILVLSNRAFQSLNQIQKNKLSEKADLLPIELDLIEDLAGGSARCMMAEIHLPLK